MSSVVDAGALPSWLATPQGAEWPEREVVEPNPFVRYRKLLWSWHKAMDAGWTDEEFVATVRSLNDSVESVDGVGFAITRARWNASLAGEASTSRVFVKDETLNVGGSHKARHLMGLLLHLAVDARVNDARLAISSCGNAAIGAATVARAAGRPIDVYIPTWADSSVVNTLSALDATVHVCERRGGEVGDPCMLRFQEAVDEGSLAFGVQATENRWTLDGGRTIGWELADQFLDEVPDRVLIQVGGGALLTSCGIGLIEAEAFGAIDSIPEVWAVQAEGCAPFDRAWRSISTGGSIDDRLVDAHSRADSVMTPWDAPTSMATGILDDVTYDWLGVARALLMTGGRSVVATEDDIVAAQSRAADSGYDADATGSAGYAGLMRAVADGLIDRDSTASVLMTGVRR